MTPAMNEPHKHRLIVFRRFGGMNDRRPPVSEATHTKRLDALCARDSSRNSLASQVVCALRKIRINNAVVIFDELDERLGGRELFPQPAIGA